MKRLIHIMMFSFPILIIGCEKESNDLSNIKIETGKNEYVINSKIDVIIKSNLNIQAKHFICDNEEIAPSEILKNVNGIWIETEYYIACTHMGPMGYIGVLDISETKRDTLSLFNSVGKYKLRYKFVVGDDTLNIDSNAFLLYGLEL